MQNIRIILPFSIALAVCVTLLIILSCQQKKTNRETTISTYQIRHEDAIMTIIPINDRRPMVQLIDRFLTDEEIDHLVHLGSDRFYASTVVSDDINKEILLSEDRTSYTCHLKRSEDEIVQKIEKRTSALTRMPCVNIEPFQLTRYQSGQQYKPHFDWFDPGSVSYKTETYHGYLDENDNEVSNQRMITMFIYLTEPTPKDMECAGGTVFPNCKNIEVIPKKGMAVLFHNHDDIGHEDHQALHGGLLNRCQTANYTKLGMNIWIRKLPYRGDVNPRTYITDTAHTCEPTMDSRVRIARMIE